MPDLTIIKAMAMVAEFHAAFKQPVRDTPIAQIPAKEARLRYSVALEELNEYEFAYATDDNTEILDALTDQLYVLCGTIIAHGMQGVIGDAFKEVHASNMSKLGSDGEPIFREDGKILKGPDYVKPDLDKILYPLPFQEDYQQDEIL